MAVTKTPITLPVKKVPKYQEPTSGNMITLGLLLTGLIAFVFLRMPDIIAALVPFPMTGLSVFILLLTIATTIVKPPTEMSKLVKRFGILIVVIFQLKSVSIFIYSPGFFVFVNNMLYFGRVGSRYQVGSKVSF